MNKKILIIDDDTGDRELMKTYLEEIEGCEIYEAVSGETGIEMAAAEQPGIIVLDTNLPGINGFETCRKIRALEGLVTKIVVITGAVDVVDAGKAREAGADEYTVKTADCEALMMKVKKYF